MTSLFWPGSALPLSVAGPRATARAAWPSSSLPEAEIALHHSGVGETEAQPKVVAAGPIIIIVIIIIIFVIFIVVIIIVVIITITITQNPFGVFPFRVKGSLGPGSSKEPSTALLF